MVIYKIYLYLYNLYSTRKIYKQMVYYWSRGQNPFNDTKHDRFEKTEVSGHMAAVGHIWAPGNAQDHRDMDGAQVQVIDKYMYMWHCDQDIWKGEVIGPVDRHK